MKTTYKVVDGKLERVEKGGDHLIYQCKMKPPATTVLKTQLAVIAVLGVIECSCGFKFQPSDDERSFSA